MTNAQILNRPSSFMAMALLLLLIPLAGGCSLRLPGRELSMGYAAGRNGTEHRVVGGLDLRFGDGWPGLNAGLGATTLSSVAPAGSAPAQQAETSSGFAPPLAWTWSRNGVTRHAGWFYRTSHSPTGAVQLVGEHRLGLGANWHPAATSFDLGYSRQTVVIAQPGAEGTFLIDFTSRRPLDGGISRIQTNQNNTPAP